MRSAVSRTIARPCEAARDVADRRELGRAAEHDARSSPSPRSARSRPRGPTARRRTRTRGPRPRSRRRRSAGAAGWSGGPRAPPRRRSARGVRTPFGASLSAGRSFRRSRRRRRRRRASPRRSPAAWRRPGQPCVGHFQTHQRSLLVERRRLGAERGGQTLAFGHETGDRRGAIGLGLARVRVVLADVRGHGLLRWRARSGTTTPVTASCERSPVTGARSIGQARGSSARTTRRPAARRCAGRSSPRRSPSAARTTVDELDRVLVRRGSRRTPRLGTTSWPSSAQGLGHARAVARLEADVGRRREVLARLDEPAWRRDGRADVEPAVDDARSRTGRGSAAARRRPSSRRRSTGRAWPSRNSIPGSSVWSVRLRGARTFAWSGSRLK